MNHDRPAGPAVPYVGASQQTAALRLKSYGLTYTLLERWQPNRKRQATGIVHIWRAVTNRGERWIEWTGKAWTIHKEAPCAPKAGE